MRFKFSVAIASALFFTLLAPVAHAIETGAFIDLDDIPLEQAGEFVARITGYAVELGPGATGRVTMSSPRALTLTDVLDTFDKELARNGMTAIKRGRAMLIVPLVPTTTPAAAQTPEMKSPPLRVVALPASEPPRIATLRFQAYVSDNRARVDVITHRLTGAGVKASTVRVEEDGETAYVLVIESANSDASLAAMGAVIEKLDLAALLTLPGR